MAARKAPPNKVLARLYNSGLSSAEIARRYGMAAISISQALTRAGVQKRTPSEAQMLAVAHGRATASYWLGKKQPRDMVERRVAQIRGPRHWAWKGGRSRRPYRALLEKSICARCGAKKRLAIHHRNFNHYDNRKANLRVLCSSCHQSLHKAEYWKIRRGEPGKRSNAPIGWGR